MHPRPDLSGSRRAGVRRDVPATAARGQRGGFTTGLVAGMLLGLAVALGVALYVTKVPVPFIDKVPQRSAEQDAAETQRNKDWDPNAPLASRAPRPAPSVSGAVTPAPGSGAAAGETGDVVRPARDPAAILDGRAAALPGPAPGDPAAGAPVVDAVPTILARQSPADLYVYFVQAGAFEKAEEAEAQRAKLGMLGLEARLYERNQSGRVVQRVRVGPFDTRDDAQATRDRLVSAGIEAQLLRAERETP
jgi:cell division protein FtsN